MKTFIVTGGSDGLGAAFGKLCASKNDAVVCLSRRAPHYKAHHIPTDLSDPQSIISAVEEIQERYASFDALINCAGVYSQQKLHAITFEELQRVLTLNTAAPIFLTSQLFELIKKNEADVLNVGSSMATKAAEDQCVYGASKWGLRGASLNFQQELKNTKSRVIQFNPGGFTSSLFEKFTGQEKDLTGYMNPDDVARLMLFLLELPKSMEVSDILINRK